MYCAELSWTRILDCVRGHDIAMLVIDRHLAERAPHPLERTGPGIEHDDSVVAVTIGDKQFAARPVHPHVRRAMHVAHIRVTPALVAPSDLQHQCPVRGELQQLVISNRLKARDAICRTVDSTQPDEPVRIDVNAVLTLRPLIPAPRSSPGLNEVAIRIEDHERRCRHLSQLRRNGPGSMQQPDVVFGIHGHPGHVPQDPSLWQLRPLRIDAERRHVQGLRIWRLALCPSSPGLLAANRDTDDNREHQAT